jgi:fructokinase
VVQVRVRDGEPRFSIVEEAAWDRILIDAPVRDAVATARVMVFGTLAQRTRLGGDALEAALGLCPPDCVRLVDLNVRPPFASRETIEGSLARATAVKVNEREARIVSELFGQMDVVRWLVEERGLELVALTRAERGSVLATPTERVEHPGVPAPRGGDAVGAGDAFTAVLAWGLSQGWALERLGRAANRYASFVASRPGATPVATPSAVAEMIG